MQDYIGPRRDNALVSTKPRKIGGRPLGTRTPLLGYERNRGADVTA